MATCNGMVRAAVWGARRLPRGVIVVSLLALLMPASTNTQPSAVAGSTAGSNEEPTEDGGCHSTWGCPATMDCAVNEDSSSSIFDHSSGGILKIHVNKQSVTCGQNIIHCTRNLTRSLDMNDGSEPEITLISASCCQPDSQDADEDGVCSCNAGFTKDTTVENTDASAPLCSPCTVGTYKNSSGEHTCSECASGKYSDEGASTCTDCPATLKAPLPRANVSCSGECDGICTSSTNAKSSEISDGPDQCEYTVCWRSMNRIEGN